ncbi:MAG: hypothetical protein GX931_02900 [Acholeplasmataceae bacterium]|jgi:hypothetical protein|nr:hypothetical protein [Acholeplasmataceae bacterium]
MKLLITIIERGKGEDVTDLISKYKIDYNIIFLGQGTATSSMLDYFSLTNTDKDIVLSLIDEGDEDAVLNDLEEEFEFSKKHLGMAFTVDLTSMNRLAYKKLMEEGVLHDK